MKSKKPKIATDQSKQKLSKKIAFKELLEALRHPSPVFGSAAMPSVESGVEYECWTMAAKSVAKIHKNHKTHPTRTIEMLNAIGEFVRDRSLRLCGSPFLSILSTYSGDERGEINYVIPLDVEDDESSAWTLRLRENLFDLDLLLDAVDVRFSGRSATYFSDRRLYGRLQLRPMPLALELMR